MDIRGINNLSNVNYYKKIASTKVNNEKIQSNVDRIEISKESKTLLENEKLSNYDNKEKIINIKKQLSNGSYTYDAKLIAKSMIDSMKGKE